MAYPRDDAFYRRAKKEGYRSRAAYKLVELNQRFHLMKPGQKVVDFGAAPGGWLQVAAQIVGAQGKVIGIDLQPIEPIKAGNVITMQADITTDDIVDSVRDVLGSQADCVLSDLAPHLSGIRDADIARSVALARAAFAAAQKLLRPGGTFLVKTFTGQEADDFYAELRSRFRSVRRSRPEATRKGSSEIYLIGQDFKGNP